MRGRPDLARLAISLFIVLHWGAIGLYLAPSTEDGIDRLPPAARPLARATVLPVVRGAGRLATPYLDLTSTRQSWKLFAPYPAAWVPDVHAVAYFAAEDAAGPGWRVDTLALRGGGGDPYPHFARRRARRALDQLGYAGEGSARYRWVVARELCRSLADGGGRLPDGIELFSVWRRIRTPWEAKPEEPPYRQRLGGWACDRSESLRRRRAPWPGYGLPGAVTLSGSVVRAGAPAAADSAPAGVW